ncbi:MAG: cupin domain-containing protein [Oscillospiraceae bacterium]|nr:cupin domain-containing protein [Oscillospiraceae bacterium]
MEEILKIAERIRELREICGFSKEEMAKKLELDYAVYAGYEETGHDIPINVLFRVSHLLNVDLGELLTGQSPHLNSYCLVRRGHGQAVDRYPGYTFQSLAYTYKNRMMEPLLVTMEPSEDTPAPFTHSGQEFNFCLEGNMEVLFDGKAIALGEGDCVYFNPARPHAQRAVGGRSRFLTVIME